MAQVTLADISKYFTEEVVEKAFKLRTNSEDTVQSINISRAAPAGEGLISAVYRIEVYGKKHTAKFIAKGLVNDPLLRKSLDCPRYFKREALFFSTILPALCKIQKESGAKERIQKVIPKFYGCHIDGENDFILMEDMTESEFLPVTVHPTLHKRNLILKALAHFHAVSFALRQKAPEVFDKLTNGLEETYYSDSNRNWYASYFQSAVEIDKKVLIEVEGSESIYFQRLLATLKDDVYGELIRIAGTQSDHPVLNHGDAWCPNFLVCKDKAVAIDFQMVRCASPITDLTICIVMCSGLCHNKDDFFDAVNKYYGFLEYYLKDMGLDASLVFPFEILRKELYKYGKFGILASLTSFPLLASERRDTLRSLDTMNTSIDRIPLDEIWPLTPIKHEEHKMSLVNAIRVAVDVGLI